MADRLITFEIDGSDARNGNIPVEVFVAKLKLFVSALYGFDRAFTKRSRRLIDLEIMDLSRASPARVLFNSRSRVQGYSPEPSVHWAFDQMGRIYRNEPVDEAVTQSTIDNVIELARFRESREPDFKSMRATYEDQEVRFDKTMASQALIARETIKTLARRAPWQAGVSRGDVFGHLRGVMDFDGEREFFICPPSGAEQIRCVFPESLRALMNTNLFKLVRIYGVLNYDGESPFPNLLQAEKIEGIDETENSPHFLDFVGAFGHTKGDGLAEEGLP